MSSIGKKISSKAKYIISILTALFMLLALSGAVYAQASPYPPQSSSGGVGVEGKISSPPPTQAATITSPGNGAVFSTLPVTVTGFCPAGLMVKLFKNNVFSGSVMCDRSSYSIQIDLFSGRNDLIARVYDSLDQAGPDSNTVTVTFNDNAARPDIVARVSLTSNYARRGANPKELLTWPMIVSGGTAPYAISVDWGDSSTSDLYSITIPGEFSIKHQYDQSGTYRVLVKASDKNGAVAYLQVVAVANGQATQNVAGASASKSTGSTSTVVLWQPAAIAIPLIASTFWLGKRYEVNKIKKRLQKGEHPLGG
jgi:hypothetical protein